MASTIPDETLDEILAIQFVVAWAGEGRCEPKRLGWWDTDLIDGAGGGDLLARLLPQTHAWASLEAVREAARRTDAKARSKMANPDKMRSIFFLGFELDEQLSDRLSALKRKEGVRPDALPLPLPLSSEFSPEKFSIVFKGTMAFDRTPSGRQLRGKRPEAPNEMVRQLAAALIPITDQYPLAFYGLEG